MRKLIAVAVLLYSAPQYMQAQVPFQLTGKIGTLNAPAKIVLSYVDSSENIITDSAILRNGRFEFSGHVAYPTRASLELYHQGGRSANGQPDILTVYLDSEPVKVTSKDSVKNAIVKGSGLNGKYTGLQAALKPFNKQFAALSEANARYAAEKSDKEAVMPGMKERWAAVANKKKAVVRQFIADNPGSYLSLEMLPMVLSVPYKLEELEPLFYTLAPAVRNTAAGKKMAGQIIKLKTIGVGSLAPDFEQNDTSGVPVKLSSFRGKYVLVDFWASWCHPCRADNPYLVKSFNKYKDRNFTVLGVSLDRPNDREKWLKAIHDDGLAWTNVSDLAFWKNAAAKLYGVHAIPQNYLVDPSGKIIAQDLHGEELDKKLNELLR
ncbi:TlpA disulfide reductase family protein [Chitinophaga sp. YIM B06452]|uniref:TlpA disulfide reductase family protein n=1 Tax=Chitinophaga sp. YIM B06452 TaxID=3082158 RepID=UPI0031FEA193